MNVRKISSRLERTRGSSHANPRRSKDASFGDRPNTILFSLLSIGIQRRDVGCQMPDVSWRQKALTDIRHLTSVFLSPSHGDSAVHDQHTSGKQFDRLAQQVGDEV